MRSITLASFILFTVSIIGVSIQAAPVSPALSFFGSKSLLRRQADLDEIDPVEPFVSDTANQDIDVESQSTTGRATPTSTSSVVSSSTTSSSTSSSPSQSSSTRSTPSPLSSSSNLHHQSLSSISASATPSRFPSTEEPQLSPFNSKSHFHPIIIACGVVFGLCALLIFIYVAKRIAHHPRFANEKDYPDGFPSHSDSWRKRIVIGGEDCEKRLKTRGGGPGSATSSSSGCSDEYYYPQTYYNQIQQHQQQKERNKYKKYYHQQRYHSGQTAKHGSASSFDEIMSKKDEALHSVQYPPLDSGPPPAYNNISSTKTPSTAMPVKSKKSPANNAAGSENTIHTTTPLSRSQSRYYNASRPLCQQHRYQNLRNASPPLIQLQQERQKRFSSSTSTTLQSNLLTDFKPAGNIKNQSHTTNRLQKKNLVIGHRSKK